MEKQKKILYISLSILGLVTIVDIALFIASVVSIVFFAVSVGLLVVFIIANIVLLVLAYHKLKKKKVEPKKIEPTGDYKTDLYGALGIPIQYNKDGTIKDIYQLLGIEPIYDEDGNRILTAYELLGVLPKFDENGNEIPLVFVIKNGVKGIAKVDLSSRVLTRKLTEAEKEELVIKETLQKKLTEAEQTGDKQKETAIKKALNETKKPAKKKEEYKPINYTVGEGSKPIKRVDISQLMTADKIANSLRGGSIFDFFAKGADEEAHVGAKPPVRASNLPPNNDKHFHDPNLFPQHSSAPKDKVVDPFEFSVQVLAKKDKIKTDNSVSGRENDMDDESYGLEPGQE